MKKIRILYIIIVIFVATMGCTTKFKPIKETEIREAKEEEVTYVKTEDISREETSYSIVEGSYLENQINLQYPQIINLGDNRKEEEINNLIKKDIIQGKDEILGDNINDAIKPTLELNYDIKMQSDYILSVLYTGKGVLEGGHYVWFTTHSITIDLENNKKLSLTDFVNIDSDLIRKIRESTNITNKFVDSEVGKENLIVSLQNIEDEKIINGLKNDVRPYAFCITPNSLIISVDIPHITGDFAIIELNGDYRIRD